MTSSPQGTPDGARMRRLRLLPACFVLLAGVGLTGCASLTNPVLEGLPVRCLPPEVLGKSRDETVTLPPTLLEQPAPDVYRLDWGDILGVYIEGILGGERARPGEPPVPPPVHFSESLFITPSLGYPIDVREDGTIQLPLVKPITVRGLTIQETQEAIRRAYVDAGIIKAGRERILITLSRQRTYRVYALRQEVGGFNSGPQGLAGISLIAGTTKRGSGHVLELPAYQNDVFNVLAQTGGLPGLDACNEVVVMRRPSAQDRATAEMALQAKNPEQVQKLLAGVKCPIIKIPLRVKPGTPAPPTEDIILNTGDLVFIEAREFDRFYTGGLLPTGEYVLPRDHDLNVVEAVSTVRGPLISSDLIIPGGGLGPSAEQVVTSNGSPTVSQVIPTGFGTPSPTMLTVLRHTPCGAVIPIRVDLARALCDPRENILVQPLDVLILQETPGEALARYFSQQFHFNFNLVLFRGKNGSVGTFTGTVP